MKIFVPRDGLTIAYIINCMSRPTLSPPLANLLPTEPSHAMPKKNPEYFTEVPSNDWDIIDYLDRSLSPATAATYGLSYLDESGLPSEMAESHGRNMYRWKEALKDISMNSKNRIAKLLLKSREVCILH